MSDFFRESKEAAAEILESLGDSEGGLDDAANRMVDHLKNVFEQSMEHIADVQQKYGAATAETDADASGPQVTSLSDLVQSVNENPEGADSFRPGAPIAPAAPESTAGDPPAPMAVDLSVLDDVLADPAPPPGGQPPVAPSAPPVAPPAPVERAPEAPPAAEPPARVERGTPRASTGRLPADAAAPPDADAAPTQRILRRQAHLPARKGGKVAMSAQEIKELRALKQVLLAKGIVTREEIDRQLG